MRRRPLLLGIAALAGLGAGIGMWRVGARSGAQAGHDGTDGTAQAPAAGGDLDLWSLRFERPEGGEIAMADLRGKPLLINFWATWCPPCVREMPALDRFAGEFAARGLQVLGVAVDRAEPVREFLGRSPVSFPIGIAGFSGTDLARRLGNESGALPFSVLLGAGGQMVQRKLGETHLEELRDWARALER